MATIENKKTEHKHKNNHKIKHFPRNFRFITEGWFVIGFLSLLLLGSVIYLGYQLKLNVQKKALLQQKRAVLQKEVSYWQGVTNKYKGYRDGYIKLAILEYQLGNFQQSQVYLQQAKTIDPNDQEIDILEKSLTAGNTR